MRIIRFGTYVKNAALMWSQRPLPVISSLSGLYQLNARFEVESRLLSSILGVGVLYSLVGLFMTLLNHLNEFQCLTVSD